MIEKGEAGAVAAYDASRLWRDQTHVWYNDFIQKIIQYDVPVILNTRTYWPKIKDDMEALRVEFMFAQKQLEHNYNKMNPARIKAVLSGSYGGHRVPMGYIVHSIGIKGEKKYYVIYEPHARLIRWLFKRCR